MAQEIIIDIDIDGTTKVEAEGYTGTACSTATHSIELVLSGGTRVKKDDKPEAFAPAAMGVVENARAF